MEGKEMKRWKEVEAEREGDKWLRAIFINCIASDFKDCNAFKYQNFYDDIQSRLWLVASKINIPALIEFITLFPNLMPS